MIKIGMMVADRYEVLEKIGAGGMSDVYRAKDHKLNRFVAIKVLKQEFAENTEFRSKFRMEAQAAAGLMHPNIVNVYDVGEESGFSYIVMELVEGITLKKYIEKKARLSVKEAVSIAIQVGHGIEAAHKNHIIHRDIKPQNIIISKDGKVKVTDFGIAKAATSNTITSNVMGSVHYTSPEQVRGGFSDEKSDIYSLGITLFEMLTGRVPYNGETTVAVAIQHIQEPMPSPRQFVPEIPVSVEKIVLKCTQKKPDRRYQSATELIEDLKKSLISPDEDFVKLDTDEIVGVTRRVTDDEMRVIKDSLHKENEEGKRNTGEMPLKSDRRTGSMREAAPEYEEETYSRPRKSSGTNSKNGNKKPSGSKNNRNKTSAASRNSKSGRNNKKKGRSSGREKGLELITTILVVAAAIIVGVIFIYIVGNVLGLFGGNKNGDNGNTAVNTGLFNTGSSMPDVVGMTQVEAEDTLKALGLIVTVEYQFSSSAKEGTVFLSSIMEGQTVNSGDKVTIFVSSGTDGVLVPNVTGLSQAEATVKLSDPGTGAGFNVEIVKENSDTVEKGTVIRQDPAEDSRIPRGSTVTLYVSLGTETAEVSMPDLRGKDEVEAIETLVELGLDYETPAEEQYSDTYEQGQVCYQNYSPGITISTGSKIVYKVSKGLEPAVYSCHHTVSAPADYIAGTPATLTLFKMDTQEAMWSVTANDFPQEINISGIDSVPYGMLYVTYTVSTLQDVTDMAGNVTQQAVTSQKTTPGVKVQFTKVQ